MPSVAVRIMKAFSLKLTDIQSEIIQKREQAALANLSKRKREPGDAGVCPLDNAKKTEMQCIGHRAAARIDKFVTAINKEIQRHDISYRFVIDAKVQYQHTLSNIVCCQCSLI